LINAVAATAFLVGGSLIALCFALPGLMQELERPHGPRRPRPGLIQD
jgi:hypothetical protein